MKRSLIASFAVLGMIAAPAVAATAAKANTSVSKPAKAAKAQKKVAGRQQKAAPKIASKGR